MIWDGDISVWFVKRTYFFSISQYIHSFHHNHTLHSSVAIRRGSSPSPQFRSAQWVKPPWGAEPGFELGPALQQADALSTDLCRTLIDYVFYRHVASSEWNGRVRAHERRLLLRSWRRKRSGQMPHKFRLIRRLCFKHLSFSGCRAWRVGTEQLRTLWQRCGSGMITPIRLRSYLPDFQIIPYRMATCKLTCI